MSAEQVGDNMWRRVLRLALWLLIALLLQATLVPALGSFLGHLDLILAITCSAALFYGPKAGSALGLIAGLLRDIVLGFGLGFYALPLFVIGYGVGHFSRVVFRDSILVPFLAGFSGAAIQWLILMLQNGFLYGYWISGRFLTQLLLLLLANSLLVPAIYALFNRQGEKLVVQSRGN